MVASMRQPIGSAPSRPGDERPRAQVSYEGEDEFSTMSLDPQRREAQRSEDKLRPRGPGENAQVKVDPLKATNDKGLFGVLRRIFAR